MLRCVFGCRRRPGLGLLVAGLLVATAAQAQDWHYRVRPGDNLWELAQRYLDPSIGWQRLQQINGIEDPHVLPPGERLRIPVRWLRIQPALARVVAVVGSATVTMGDGEPPRPLEADMDLGIGATLTTGEGASLTLQFADGSRLLMQGDSSVVLDTLSAYGDTGMVDTRVRLQRGRVSGTVQPEQGPGSHFVINGPSATASVRGTEFRTASDGAATLWAEVTEGTVAVSGGGTETRVDAGFGLRAEGDGVPETPVPLLAAPRLDGFPERLEQVGSQVSWDSVEGAAAYRLQLSPGADFASLVHDGVVETASAWLPDLADGVYHLRVRAVDEAGIEGFDAVRALLLDAHPQAPFARSPRHGETSWRPRPQLTWTRSAGAEAYDLELAREPGFAAPLAARSGIDGDSWRPAADLEVGDYYWRVASRDAAGERGPWSEPGLFHVSSEPPLPDTPTAGRAGQLTFRWPAGAGHRAYRFQIAADQDFREIVHETTAQEAELTVPSPGPGTWYARIQPLDAAGVAGPFGATQTFEVDCRRCRWAALGAALFVILAL